MPSPFVPPSIPSGSTLAGSPFSPGSLPGSGSGSGGVVAMASGVLNAADILTACGWFDLGANVTAGATWPTANLAILYPFSLPAANTLNRVIWFNGAAVSGNVDGGVFNEDGTRVGTIGSTAQAGTNVPQVANVGAVALAAGSYFMALCCDNTTGQFSRWGYDQRILRGVGLQQAAAAVPLGASLTLANPANAFAPLMAIGFVTAT